MTAEQYAGIVLVFHTTRLRFAEDNRALYQQALAIYEQIINPPTGEIVISSGPGFE